MTQRRRAGSCPAAAALALLSLGAASCASTRLLDDREETVVGSRILAYRVCHDAPDHLALEVRYVYDGSRPRRAFLGAITTVNGRSLGYWAYRPDPVFEGTHWARVLVGLNEDAPVVHQTTEIRFSMYEGGGAAFEEVSIPYYKRWRWHPSAGHPPVCHREWGAGCGGPIPTGPPPERRPCASGRWQVRRPG